MRRCVKRFGLGAGTLLCVASIFCVYLYVFGPSIERPCDYTVEVDEGVNDYGDADGDGVPDGADILNSALTYIAERPMYESRYYSKGYPDDGFGVCTDVVTFGCLGAGFDLRELVSDDIKCAPEEYSVFTPDKNIDFRRVRVLETFFERNALSLSCELEDEGQWQGGDIVVFENHIGIVSDRRNAQGIPYLIHHASRLQLAYEEDALGRSGTIVGHYRMT